MTISSPQPLSTLHRRCAACQHRDARPAALESAIPGLAALGSGFGASVADSRLCRRHDRLVTPHDTCAAFEPVR